MELRNQTIIQGVFRMLWYFDIMTFRTFDGLTIGFVFIDFNISLAIYIPIIRPFWWVAIGGAVWKKVKVKGERRKRREESDKKGTSGGFFCLIKKIPHPWEQRWSHSCHLKIECVHFMSWDTRTIYIETTRTHPEGYFKHELYFKHDGNSFRGLSNISGETWRQAFSGDSLKIRTL